MKQLLLYIFTILSVSSFSQEKDTEKEALLALKKANDFVYDGNEKVANNNFVSAEMAYRKALSEQVSSVAGAYNLGTSYYQEGNYNEALFRLQQAAKNATSKEEKHKVYHNIGNILMKENKCQEAVDAYKNALRNNPTDDESRYNLGIAKQCAEKQNNEQQDDNKDDQNKDQNQDQQNQDKNQDQNKENQDQQDQKEGDNKEDQKDDQGDQDKKEGDDQKDDQGKPKDDNKDQGKGGDNQKKEPQQPQPKPGQLSPQQVKNLLEAMNNQEQKVQEKMNAEKQKGVKIQTDKDW